MEHNDDANRERSTLSAPSVHIHGKHASDQEKGIESWSQVNMAFYVNINYSEKRTFIILNTVF